MKIATWNIDRLHKSNYEITKLLNKIDADILVLTETDSRLSLEYPYKLFSSELCKNNSSLYIESEHRVAIYSKMPFAEQIETYNPFESLCVEIETEYGPIAVYGTVMGAFGNRNASFLRNVCQQMEDIQRLVSENRRICVCGDFNLSFSDNYYFTEKGRTIVLETFNECEIEIVTLKQRECIDHIALSSEISNNNITVGEWNINKKLSDHKGIYIDIR